LLAAVIVTLAAPTLAQSASTDLPDRFQIDAGGFPFRKIGFGGQYKYYSYRYERGTASAELGGRLRFHGAQAFVSFLF
jgi:hypothetical protein